MPSPKIKKSKDLKSLPVTQQQCSIAPSAKLRHGSPTHFRFKCTQQIIIPTTDQIKPKQIIKIKPNTKTYKEEKKSHNI